MQTFNIESAFDFINCKSANIQGRRESIHSKDAMIRK